MTYLIKIWDTDNTAGWMFYDPAGKKQPATFWGRVKLLTRVMLMI
jgi:hypothetical protein